MFSSSELLMGGASVARAFVPAIGEGAAADGVGATLLLSGGVGLHAMTAALPATQQKIIARPATHSSQHGEGFDGVCMSMAFRECYPVGGIRGFVNPQDAGFFTTAACLRR